MSVNMDNEKEETSKGAFFCDLCKLEYVSGEELEEHSWSLLHHKKLDKEKGRDYLHSCSLCDDSVVGLLAFTKHIHSDKHQKSVQERRIKNLPPPEKPQQNEDENEESSVSDNRDSSDVSYNNTPETWPLPYSVYNNPNQRWIRPGYEPRLPNIRFRTIRHRPPEPLQPPRFDQRNIMPLMRPMRFGQRFPQGHGYYGNFAERNMPQRYRFGIPFQANPAQLMSNDRHSPQMIGGRQSPQMVSGIQSPQMSDGRQSPQMISGGQLPQTGCRKPSPQMVSGRQSPQMSDGRESPHMISGRQSPQTGCRKPSPQMVSGRQSPQMSDRRQYPQMISGRQLPQTGSEKPSPQMVSGRHLPQSSSGMQSPHTITGIQSTKMSDGSQPRQMTSGRYLQQTSDGRHLPVKTTINQRQSQFNGQKQSSANGMSGQQQSQDNRMPGKKHQFDNDESLYDVEKFQGFNAVKSMKEKLKGLSQKRPRELSNGSNNSSKRARTEKAAMEVDLMKHNRKSIDAASSLRSRTGPKSSVGSFTIMSRTTENCSDLNASNAITDTSYLENSKGGSNTVTRKPCPFVSDDEEQSLAMFVTENLCKKKDTPSKTPSNNENSTGFNNNNEGSTTLINLLSGDKPRETTSFQMMSSSTVSGKSLVGSVNAPSDKTQVQPSIFKTPSKNSNISGRSSSSETPWASISSKTPVASYSPKTPVASSKSSTVETAPTAKPAAAKSTGHTNQKKQYPALGDRPERASPSEESANGNNNATPTAKNPASKSNGNAYQKTQNILQRNRPDIGRPSDQSANRNKKTTPVADAVVDLLSGNKQPASSRGSASDKGKQTSNNRPSVVDLSEDESVSASRASIVSGTESSSSNKNTRTRVASGSVAAGTVAAGTVAAGTVASTASFVVPRTTSMQQTQGAKVVPPVKGEVRGNVSLTSSFESSIMSLDESFKSLSDSSQCEFLYQDGRRCPSNTNTNAKFCLYHQKVLRVVHSHITQSASSSPSSIADGGNGATQRQPTPRTEARKDAVSSTKTTNPNASSLTASSSSSSSAPLQPTSVVSSNSSARPLSSSNSALRKTPQASSTSTETMHSDLTSGSETEQNNDSTSGSLTLSRFRYLNKTASNASNDNSARNSLPFVVRKILKRYGSNLRQRTSSESSVGEEASNEPLPTTASGNPTIVQHATSISQTSSGNNNNEKQHSLGLVNSSSVTATTASTARRSHSLPRLAVSVASRGPEPSRSSSGTVSHVNKNSVPSTGPKTYQLCTGGPTETEAVNSSISTETASIISSISCASPTSIRSTAHSVSNVGPTSSRTTLTRSLSKRFNYADYTAAIGTNTNAPKSSENSTYNWNLEPVRSEYQSESCAETTANATASSSNRRMEIQSQSGDNAEKSDKRISNANSDSNTAGNNLNRQAKVLREFFDNLKKNRNDSRGTESPLKIVTREQKQTISDNSEAGNEVRKLGKDSEVGQSKTNLDKSKSGKKSKGKVAAIKKASAERRKMRRKERKAVKIEENAARKQRQSTNYQTDVKMLLELDDKMEMKSKELSTVRNRMTEIRNQIQELNTELGQLSTAESFALIDIETNTRLRERLSESWKERYGEDISLAIDRAPEDRNSCGDGNGAGVSSVVGNLRSKAVRAETNRGKSAEDAAASSFVKNLRSKATGAETYNGQSAKDAEKKRKEKAKKNRLSKRKVQKLQNLNSIAKRQEDSNIASASSTVAHVTTSPPNIPLVSTTLVNIPSVSTAFANFPSVSTAFSNIPSVSTASANVTSVSTAVLNIPSVSTAFSNVPLVSTASANVTSVSTAVLNIPSVSTAFSNVPLVSTVSANVTSVSTAVLNIPSVSTAFANITSVSTAFANITSVSTSFSSAKAITSVRNPVWKSQLVSNNVKELTQVSLQTALRETILPRIYDTASATSAEVGSFYTDGTRVEPLNKYAKKVVDTDSASSCTGSFQIQRQNSNTAQGDSSAVSAGNDPLITNKTTNQTDRMSLMYDVRDVDSSSSTSALSSLESMLTADNSVSELANSLSNAVATVLSGIPPESRDNIVAASSGISRSIPKNKFIPGHHKVGTEATSSTSESSPTVISSSFSLIERGRTVKTASGNALEHRNAYSIPLHSNHSTEGPRSNALHSNTILASSKYVPRSRNAVSETAFRDTVASTPSGIRGRNNGVITASCSIPTCSNSTVATSSSYVSSRSSRSSHAGSKSQEHTPISRQGEPIAAKHGGLNSNEKPEKSRTTLTKNSDGNNSHENSRSAGNINNRGVKSNKTARKSLMGRSPLDPGRFEHIRDSDERYQNTETLTLVQTKHDRPTSSGTSNVRTISKEISEKNSSSRSCDARSSKNSEEKLRSYEAFQRSLDLDMQSERTARSRSDSSISDGNKQTYRDSDKKRTGSASSARSEPDQNRQHRKRALDKSLDGKQSDSTLKKQRLEKEPRDRNQKKVETSSSPFTSNKDHKNDQKAADSTSRKNRSLSNVQSNEVPKVLLEDCILSPSKSNDLNIVSKTTPSPRKYAKSKKQEANNNEKTKATTEEQKIYNEERIIASYGTAVTGIKIYKEMICTCGYDNLIRIHYNRQNDSSPTTLIQCTKPVTCIEIDKSDKDPRLFVGRNDRRVEFFSLNTFRSTHNFHFKRKVTSMHCAFGNLYVGLWSGFISTISLQTNRLTGSFYSHPSNGNSVTCMVSTTMYPERRYIIAALFRKNVAVHEFLTGRLIAKFSDSESMVTSLVIHRTKLFCGSVTGDVLMFDLEKMDFSGLFCKQKSGITALTSTGNKLLVASSDHVIRSYNMEQNQLLQVISGHEQAVSCFAVENNYRIYSGDMGGVVKSFKIHAEINIVCEWQNCGLNFPCLDQIKNHLIDDHFKLAGKVFCKWKSCLACFIIPISSKKQAVALDNLKVHIEQHVESAVTAVV